MKSKDSALRKIKTECSDDASRVKDLARFAVVFQDCLQIKQFVEGLLEQKQPDWAQDVKLVSLKNKYSNGHLDLNLTLGVRLASGNVHLCEVQVNLENMMEAYHMTHEFYQEVSMRFGVFFLNESINCPLEIVERVVDNKKLGSSESA